MSRCVKSVFCFSFCAGERSALTAWVLDVCDVNVTAINLDRVGFRRETLILLKGIVMFLIIILIKSLGHRRAGRRSGRWAARMFHAPTTQGWARSVRWANSTVKATRHLTSGLFLL